MADSASLVYLTMKENKPMAFITGVSSILYAALSYYEFIHFNEISRDRSQYRRVFSLLASTAKTDTFCSIPFPFENIVYSTCLKAEEDLFNALAKSGSALAKHILIIVFKPLLLEVCKQSLLFSLRSTLLTKWLANRHNQIGLRMLDNKLAMETREIVYDYSYNIISGILGRISALIDIIIAIGNARHIYHLSKELTSDLHFNLLRFVIIAFSVFLATNILLNICSRKYTEKALTDQSSLRNTLTFNMDHAVQVECSQATSHELNLLYKQLTNMTKAHAIKNGLNIGITTTSILFTHFLSFSMLGIAIPSLVKNPALYFSLEHVGNLITNLCLNLLYIFEKFSSSATLHYSYTKMMKFVALIKQYQTLLGKRNDCAITVDPTHHFTCDLQIKYPNNSVANEAPYIILQEQYKQEFFVGKVYVISGASGSGKSSFFNAIVGINPYVTGKMTVTTPENIIYVPQKPIFKQNLNWTQTISYPFAEQDYCDVALESNILRWVTLLNLDTIYHQAKHGGGWINHLSGGEAQRLAIIQALSKVFLLRKKSEHTILLLLDESMNALDQEMQDTVCQLLHEQVAQNRITAIHIDHSDQNTIQKRYAQDCIIYFN